MINVLLENDLLPKSPIPTSANIVKITSKSTQVAQAIFYDQEKRVFEVPYDVDQIQQYCLNKEKVKQVEIDLPHPHIPSHVAILDTPGIDATDPEDRRLTESSFHLVDYLFYITDYNHVLSKANILFLKQLHKDHLPFSLVINQIDKHDEREIPFKTYKKNIKETLQHYGIKPREIYFTSLKEKEHKHNEFDRFKADFFQKMLIQTTANLPSTLNRSMHQLVQAHKLFLKKQCENNLKNFPTADQPLNIESTLEKIEDLKDGRHTIEELFHKLALTTINNAQLMPYSMREMAKDFLISRQHNFKIGWFRSKRKTKAYQQKQLERFKNALQKTIHSTITWRLSDKILQLLHSYKINNEQIITYARNLSIDINKEYLKQSIQQQAVISNKYVLNYTNQISQEIKQRFKKEINKLWSLIEKNIIKFLSKKRKYMKKRCVP